MADKAPPSFEELREKRAQEWARAQAIATQNMANLHAAIQRMPDVASAPSPDLPWSHPDLSCPVDGGQSFIVRKWVTVNGVRHRAECECTTCGTVSTWDWTDKMWLP